METFQLLSLFQQCRLFGMTFSSEQAKIINELERLCGDVKTLHLRKFEWASQFDEQLGNKLISLIDDDKVNIFIFFYKLFFCNLFN